MYGTRSGAFVNSNAQSRHNRLISPSVHACIVAGGRKGAGAGGRAWHCGCGWTSRRSGTITVGALTTPVLTQANEQIGISPRAGTVGRRAFGNWALATRGVSVSTMNN